MEIPKVIQSNLDLKKQIQVRLQSPCRLQLRFAASWMKRSYLRPQLKYSKNPMDKRKLNRMNQSTQSSHSWESREMYEKVDISIWSIWSVVSMMPLKKKKKSKLSPWPINKGLPVLPFSVSSLTGHSPPHSLILQVHRPSFCLLNTPNFYPHSGLYKCETSGILSTHFLVSALLSSPQGLQ